MTAQTNGYHSSLGFKIHKNRGKHLNLSGDRWLSDKRDDDGAEGLWRIHNDLYDLTDFIEFHPGGAEWLELTKGTDITEAFEAHHISPEPPKMLKKYHIRQAVTSRNSPFTFENKGFYRTLRRNIRDALPSAPKDLKDRTKHIADFLLISYLITSISSAIFSSYLIATVAGVLLAMLTIAAHSFFHQRDSFRMYYFDISLMSSRDWRISHSLSHHMYTNTIIDLQMQMFESLLQYLPKEKSFVVKYVSWLYSPVIYVSLFPLSFLRRIVRLLLGETRHVGRRDLVPFVIPTLMYLLSGHPAGTILFLWFYSICVGSLQFCFVGVNASHQRSDLFHDGDTPRSEKIDWGVAQLDTVMDRSEINNSHFLSLTNFGDHGMHHLFPTIDHAVLQFLNPVFERTCREFGVSLRLTSQLDMIRAQFLQLANSTPNPAPFRAGNLCNTKETYVACSFVQPVDLSCFSGGIMS